MALKKPWYNFYSDVPRSIDYPRITMYESLMRTVRRVPDKIAWDFMDTLCSYEMFAREINLCANALAHLGLSPGDTLTISMPTSPQGIICFYAANKLGAKASMIHPESTQKEIEFFLRISDSKMALTLSIFYSKFTSAMAQSPCHTLIVADLEDFILPVNKSQSEQTKCSDVSSITEGHKTFWWKKLINSDYPEVKAADMDTDETAVILYSGGTTGIPKGIMLSNMNVISEGMMVSAWGGLDENHSILAILPIFHGFGLGICVNATFMGGGKSILVPQFSPEIVAEMIKTKKPSFIVGVPTLYAALNKNPVFKNTDLSCLKGAFCGADTLPLTVKNEFEEIVRSMGGEVKLLEGYGLTEAVTGIIATPLEHYREDSVGVPYPDMDAKIVVENSVTEAPIGEDGELCVSGPAVMKGYLNQPEETDAVLKLHDDGKLWLHTGDIACRDVDGFFYFKLRQKRMIKSSGMNVYPAQVENVLYEHRDVSDACVIGVPDRDQVERVKAFVVLKPGVLASPAKEKELIDYCRKDLIKWSCPRSIEFRDSLPMTRVGKIAFKILQDEEIDKLRRRDDYAGE